MKPPVETPTPEVPEEPAVATAKPAAEPLEKAMPKEPAAEETPAEPVAGDESATPNPKVEKPKAPAAPARR